MLSVLTGHAGHIRDNKVLLIIRRDTNTIVNQKIYKYEQARGGVSKSFAVTDSETVACGVW